MLEKVRLAERHARAAQDGVSGRSVEEEVRQREPGQIWSSLKPVAHPVWELEDDLPLRASDKRLSVKGLEVLDRAVAALP